MQEFTLNKREEDWLALHIGEKTYKIPLATSLKLDEAAAVEDMDGAVAFFRRYIDEDVADALTLGDYSDIVRAWTDASKKAAGITPGESLASRS